MEGRRNPEGSTTSFSERTAGRSFRLPSITHKIVKNVSVRNGEMGTAQIEITRSRDTTKVIATEDIPVKVWARVKGLLLSNAIKTARPSAPPRSVKVTNLC